MKLRWLKSLTLTIALVSMVGIGSAATAAGATRTFADVTPQNPAYGPIMALAEKSIVIGYPDGLFHPQDSITRAEFAIMLNRAFKTSSQISSTFFLDVNSQAWYAPAIRAALYNGTILALDYQTNGGMYLHPDEPITRKEIAAWSARALTQAGVNMYTAETRSFSDMGSVGKFSYYVNQAASQKIVIGYPDGTFRPDGNATRADASVVVKRALDKLHP